MFKLFSRIVHKKKPVPDPVVIYSESKIALLVYLREEIYAELLVSQLNKIIRGLKMNNLDYDVIIITDIDKKKFMGIDRFSKNHQDETNTTGIYTRSRVKVYSKRDGETTQQVLNRLLSYSCANYNIFIDEKTVYDPMYAVTLFNIHRTVEPTKELVFTDLSYVWNPREDKIYISDNASNIIVNQRFRKFPSFYEVPSTLVKDLVMCFSVDPGYKNRHKYSETGLLTKDIIDQETKDILKKLFAPVNEQCTQ